MLSFRTCDEEEQVAIKRYFEQMYDDIEGRMMWGLHDKVVRRINLRTVLTACVCFEKRQKEKLAQRGASSSTGDAPTAAAPGDGGGGAAGRSQGQPDRIQYVPDEIARLIFQFVGGVPHPVPEAYSSRSLHRKDTVFSREHKETNRLFRDFSHVRRLEKLAQRAFGLKIDCPDNGAANDEYGDSLATALLYPVKISKGTLPNHHFVPTCFEFCYSVRHGTATDAPGREIFQNDFQTHAVTKGSLSILLEEFTSPMFGVSFAGRSDNGARVEEPVRFKDIRRVHFDRDDDDGQCTVFFEEKLVGEDDGPGWKRQKRRKETVLHFSLHGKMGGSFEYHYDEEYDFETFCAECRRIRPSKCAKFFVESARVIIEVGLDSLETFDTALEHAELLNIPIVADAGQFELEPRR